MSLPMGKRDLLMHVLDRCGGSRLLGRAGVWSGLLVLNYHRIGKPGESHFDRGLWSASEAQFDQHVHFLTSHYDVIGLNDIETALSAQRGRFVMITFDDGYRDNFELAAPILSAHGATATFFIATDFLDRPSVPWWDEISWMVRVSRRSEIDSNTWTIRPVKFDVGEPRNAIRQLQATYRSLETHETETFLNFLGDAAGVGRCPSSLASQLWMTWDMVREMQESGFTFGGHTASHPILSKLSAEEQAHEILEGRLRLEQELGQEITALSYPNGKAEDFSKATRNILMQHGFRWGFSFYGGYCQKGRSDPFDLPRYAMESDVSLPMLRSIAALPQVFSGG
jgi:peptidoglycan/xylan/chitin deacetylase (PgdA/CDA1 family)